MKPLGISILLLVIVSGACLSQTGTISGVVHDQETGEELVGANILISGTTMGNNTDIEGEYVIRNVPIGKYNLRVSFVGYASKVITGVNVQDGKTVELNVNLSPTTVTSEEVVVTAERVLSSEAAVLAARKKSAVIGDAISREQVKRTPDATSSDVLKRVTGVFVADNKFVYVRGMTDRYNDATLDGVAVSGVEAGKKSFAFDLIPAGLLENTTVVKSASPDLPADFTGGLVQMNTIDIPNRFVGRVSISSSYNSITTTHSLIRSQGGGNDWLGIDKGRRDLPGQIANTGELAKNLQNSWGLRSAPAPYNGGFSAMIGNEVVFNEESPEDGQLGYVGGLSYKNSFQHNEGYLDDRIQSLYNVGMRDDYNVLWGGVANLSYKFGGGLHKISMRNNFSRTAEDQVKTISGRDEGFGFINDVTLIDYNERSSYTGQLSGDHTLSFLGDMSVLWKATISSAAGREPDRKEVFYQHSIDFPDQIPEALQNRRSWSRTNDRSYTFGSDFAFPIDDAKLKFGALAEKKLTSYGDRYYTAQPANRFGFPDSIARLPISEVYTPENFNPDGWQLVDISNPKNNYSGELTLYAAYAMADIPFEVLSQRFRFAGGARLENFTQAITSHEAPPDQRYNELKNIDVLPSLNFTYIVNDITNLRLAYYHSLNRPEFRERSNVIFEDYQNKVTYGGNPNLQRAYIKNYDVRLEVFPAPGELFAASYFRKNFSGAIEESYLEAGGSNRVVAFVNSGNGESVGWEFEIRKALDFFGGYLGNFAINLNYSRVQTKVEYTEDIGNSSNTQTVTRTRPLFGQSPYSINVALLFTEPTLGTSINISFNKSGQRLKRVGGKYDPDTYEEPRDIVDIAVSQPLLNNFALKFTVKNLNGKPEVLTRDGLIYNLNSTGTTYGLELSLSM